MIAVALFAIITTNQALAQKNAETDAIRKVIDQETRSFFEKKYDLWADTWVHDFTAFRINISPTGYSKLTGFDSMVPQIKQFMQGDAYTEQQMVQYLNKFDYKYYINGNSATVFFKEGLSEKNASEESRLMVKQNGQWKIVGITIISTPDFTFLNDQLKLKSMVGRWSMVKGSYKSEPADTSFKVLSLSLDMHEIINGLESSSSATFMSGGNSSFINEVEQFVADNNISKFRYYDNVKSTSDGFYGNYGTAAFDSAENFVVSAKYDDTSAVKFKNIYTLNSDATLHMVGEFYSKDGKKTNTWSFDFVRM